MSLNHPNEMTGFLPGTWTNYRTLNDKMGLKISKFEDSQE